MFHLDLGRSPRYCDGISRRSFLVLGVAGMAHVSLAQLAINATLPRDENPYHLKHGRV